MNIVPADWMPDAHMQRVILHWTAGSHKASEFDRAHYHILIEDDGKLIRGIPSIKLNEAPKKRGYAAHTLNCNSGSVGVSMCCMGDTVNPIRVKQSPLFVGPYPVTQTQWDIASRVLAELCKRYQIRVTPKTVLTHAEVQNNLSIRQRGKWDIAVLPFDLSFDTARECGDRLRREVSAALAGPPSLAFGKAA